MSKKQALTNRSYEAEIVIFGLSAILLVIAWFQYPDTDPFWWMMPAGMISVYFTHRFTSAKLNSKVKRPVRSTEKELSWKQIALGLCIYAVMYAMFAITTGLIRGSVENYNEWLSLPIGLTYFVLAHLAVKRLEKSGKQEGQSSC